MRPSPLHTHVRLIQELYAPQKLQVAFLAILGLLNGFLGALSVSGLIPLFSFILEKPVEEKTILFRFFEQAIAVLNLDMSVASILLIVLSLFIVKAGFYFLFKYTAVVIVARYEMKTRDDLYRASLSARWPYLIHQKIGHLENTLTTDVNGVLLLMADGISLIHSVTSLCMYLFVALALSSGVTLVALAGGALLLLFYRPFLRMMRSFGRAQVKVNKKISHEINENVVGLKVIKAMRIERGVGEAAFQFFNEARAIRIRTGIAKALGSSFVQPIAVVFIGAFFWFSYTDPGDIATFAAVVYLIQQIFIFIDKIQEALYKISNAIPFAQHVLFFRDQIHKNQEDNAGALHFCFEREIAFRNVGFSHGKKSVLSSAHFSIKKGEMLGIVGPSGAGKTTIADLLLRLFEPEDGEITLDGVAIRDIRLDEWRKHIGYVPQEVFLKNATIAENIRFFHPAVTDSDMEAATRMADVYEVIRGLPDGFNTTVGERGAFLSGGQRQRLALARILARKPDILLLDEATNALDNESEAAIERAITAFKGDMTIVVIAHRLTTVMHCDRVLALEEGHIVEEGAPKALLENPGSYLRTMHVITSEKE